MEDVPFTWGHNGPKWKINDTNKNEIIHLGGYVWNSIYSVDTFNSNTFQKVTFALKIKQRYGTIAIGIINNVQHKNTYFFQKEILNNNEMKIKQNMYYCLDADDGDKKSHVINHKWKKCMNNDSINSGDILTFTIDFLSSSI